MTRFVPRSRAGAAAALVLLASPFVAVAQTAVWPGDTWEAWTSPAAAGMDAARIQDAITYSESAAIAPESGGSGYIVRGGKRVRHWGSLTALHEVKSVTKSIGSAALAFAMRDHGLRLADAARTHFATLGTPPAGNNADWLSAITIEQLATHAAGFDKPGGFCNLLRQPGTQWSYSDCGINWLADALTLKFGQDLHGLLTNSVFAPIGIEASELTWRDNASGRDTTLNGIPRRELASGVSARVDALARIGLLFARDGVWNGQRVLPEGFVALVSRPVASIASLPIDDPGRYPGATAHYGILWWNNGDGRLAGVPRDAFWGWGLTDDLLVVIPSLDLVVVRIGEAWRRVERGEPDCQTQFCTDYEVLEPFLEPLVAAVANTGPTVSAGADQSITLPATAVLTGTVSDDGLPLNVAKPVGWTLVSGGSGATIASPDQGTTNVSFTSAGTYLLRFRASDGAIEASDDVQVMVAAAPPPPPPPPVPTVTLSANPNTLTAGGTTTLTWSSTDATACTASGAWSGSKPTSSSGEASPALATAGTSTFTLQCSGPGGNSQPASVNVTVNAAPPPPASGGGGGGGGGALDAWLLGMLLFGLAGTLCGSRSLAADCGTSRRV